jgi:hypothetical protein
MAEIKKDCFFCKPTYNPYIFHCDVEDELSTNITSEGCKSNCIYYCKHEEAKEIVKFIMSVRIK